MCSKAQREAQPGAAREGHVLPTTVLLPEGARDVDMLNARVDSEGTGKLERLAVGDGGRFRCEAGAGVNLKVAVE